MEDYAKDPSVAKESEKALSARIDAYITDYLLKVMNLSEEAGELTLSGRLSGLVHRIRRNVLLTAKDVLREAENSRFIPRDFELSIGYGAGAVAPYRLRLPDGSDALLSGTADRVDVYRAEDGTNYLRIVDYKTGVKSFKLADVDAGSNLQVFMYAISISENAKGKYENAKPAAMIYMMTTAKELTLNRILAEDEIEQKASESFERQGVVLDQADVRAALETDVTSFQAKFKVPEKLAELFEEVKGAVREAGVTIKSGHVVANPKSDGRTTACDRCVYRPVCRFEKKA